MIQHDLAIQSDYFAKVEKLIIVLHGYGNCGADYEKVTRTFLKPKIRNAVFLLPDAPDPCETWTGRQWFSLTLENMSSSEIRTGLDIAAPILGNYIETKMSEYECKNVHLIGISQGAFMALEMMYYQDISRIISYCGLFTPPKDKMNLSHPDILLVHSVDDDIIPYERAIQAKSDLKKLNLNVCLHTCHKIRHTVSKEGWELAPKFLE